MTTSFDTIVIGGGHNGLVAAAYLAKAGRRVLLLEQRNVLGGAAATEPLFPDFHVDSGAADAGQFDDAIVQELALARHGLRFHAPSVALFAPRADGPPLALGHDLAQSAASIAAHSRRDAERWPDFVRQVGRVAGVLRGMLRLTPPDLGQPGLADARAWAPLGLQLKRQGSADMMTFLRVLPMPVSDYLDEWFESDALKGALAADGVLGNQLGPRAAGTALMSFYRHANGFLNTRFVAGGIGQLSAALAASARAHGAEIRTGAPVTAICLDAAGAATGVRLADGTELTARVVISSADPRRTFFNLVGPQALEPRFMRAVRNIVYRGCTAKVHLALRSLPTFRGQTDAAQLGGRIRLSPSLNYLEKAADAGKYGRFSPNPLLDATIPTLHDPALAPDGRHLLSVTVQYAPYDLRGGDWDAQREPLGDAVITALATVAPDLPDLITDRRVLTPLDWERDYGLTGGSIHHGQMSLDQLLVMRPVSGWSRYATPIPNLFLCGAGTHPGGGVTGANGRNAAQVVLAT